MSPKVNNMTDKNKYMELWRMLDTSVNANLQFAQLVINREPSNTKYFFGDYSYEIIKWIAITVFSVKAKHVDDFIYTLYGDYFEFVANPIGKDNKPQWYQLSSYKGYNDMKLKSWLMNNAHQYFARKKKREESIALNESELLEFVDYEALISLGDTQEDLSDEQCIYRNRLKKAWNLLSEKDKKVIKCLILDKKNWQIAFEELKEFINPREGRQVMESWTDKRKQDALAMMKIRSVQHLSKKFNEVKK